MIETFSISFKRDGEPLGEVAIVKEGERNTSDVTVRPALGHDARELVSAMNNVVSVLCGDVRDVRVVLDGGNPEAEFRA